MLNKKMMKRFLGLALLMGLTACSAQSVEAKVQKTAHKQAVKKTEKNAKNTTKVFETGEATYYGKGSNGHKTASGERIYTESFVAAHKTLPFGTKVKVTALWNGKTTVVKIIDRGPFGKGKIIDLSYAAARELNLLSKGVGKVTLEIVK